MVKTIYFDAAGKVHSLYKEMISNPPEGYKFVGDSPAFNSLTNSIIKSPFIYDFQEEILSKFIPVNLFKALIEKKKHLPRGISFTYSPGHVIFRDEPWIMDLEFVTQMTGYSIDHLKRYKTIIENKLSSNNCKKIICWTEACKKTILNSLNTTNFKDKIEVVPLAVKKKDFIKIFNKDQKIKILFVGSINIPGEFEYKGGKEVILAYKKLKKNYPNIQLIIRSDLPDYLKDECKKIEDITIYDNVLPWQKLESEFINAQIFWFPTYATPGLAILDAMSYELPVIATDVWANSEMVREGETGFLIEKSNKIKYYDENFIPIWDYKSNSSFMKSIIIPDRDIINNLIDKTIILLEDEKLRKKMGKKARYEIESGKFSIELRNKKLKEIFDYTALN